MTSQKLPAFLKRPARRDNFTPSARSASFSSSSTGSSIRFSSLGADDDDFFSVSTRASPPPSVQPDEEEAAEEALIADFSPVSPLPEPALPSLTEEGSSEAERAASMGEYLMRQASISSPPAVLTAPTTPQDEETPVGVEVQMEERQRRRTAEETPMKTADVLDDFDAALMSVPKPPAKAKKKASQYVKAKSASVSRPPPPPPPPPPVPSPPPPSATSTTPQPSTSLPTSATANLTASLPAGIVNSEPLSHSLPGSRSADSVFDATDVLFDPTAPRRRQAPPPPPVPPAASPPDFDSSPAPPLVPGLHPAAFSTSDSPKEAVRATGESSVGGRWIMALVASLGSLLLLRVLPSASFMLGFAWGGAVMFALLHLYRLLTTRSEPLRGTAGLIPDLHQLPPPAVPQVVDEPDDGCGVFRGWMNELGAYKPESYHINQTASVFVSLDGTQLRIQRPKTSVSKRAVWNEALPSRHMAFVHQRHFDLMGARVSLQPTGLVKKRVWSKKYPICLSFGNAPTAKQKHIPDDFEWVEPGEAIHERLFLFARTCREKEEWYRRFEAAARGKPLQLSLKRLVGTYLEEERNSVFAPTPPDGVGDASGDATVSVSFSNTGEAGSPSTSLAGQTGANPDVHVSCGAGGADDWSDRLAGNDREPLPVTYTRYMARFMPADWLLKAAKSHRLNVNYISCDPQMLWLNAILGRGVWDLLREQFWADKVKQKIQNKLRKIHLPYFIDELTVMEISLGKDFPVIRRAGKPFLNSRGLWVELEIAYSGGSSMALVTKVNLMKLRKRRHESSDSKPTGDAPTNPSQWKSPQPEAHPKKKNGACCSEEEDSAESTTDSELDENPDSEIVTDPDKGNHVGGGTSRKLLRFVDRIARSSYFHKAIENSKIIQRGMEFVSNTRIELHVEVRCLSGTLLVNIPPPPSDRLWYGFKPCPKLVLAARPKVGEKELTMARLTEWIEKKLELEFQRIFVMPNMDDMVVPLLLSGNPESQGHSEGIPPCS